MGTIGFVVWCLVLMLSGASIGGMGAAVWVLVGGLCLIGSFIGAYWEFWAILGVVYISGVVAISLYVGSSDVVGTAVVSPLVVFVGGLLIYCGGPSWGVMGLYGGLYASSTIFVLFGVSLLLLHLMWVSSELLCGCTIFGAFR